MDSREPDLERRLDRIERIEKENQDMLRGLLRRARFATAISVVRWTIVLIVALGGFFVLQSYMQKVLDLYSKVYGTSSVIDSSQDTIKQAIEQWKSIFGVGTTTEEGQ